MKRLLVAFAFAATLGAATPKLTYTRIFPGSSPDYLAVTIDRTGALEYREAPNDTQPLKAQMPATEAAPFFALAGQLNYFKAPIESGLKVANTGKKTFRYEDEAGAATQTTFNYSIMESAQQLLDKFEQVAATERAYLDLDRTIHFDKLGVNDALAEVETLWLKKQLAAPDQFYPLLNRITTHETFMHLVRDRAARLKDEFVAAASAPATDAKEK